MNSGKKTNHSLFIKKLSQASDDIWAQIWQSCDYATYFHSQEWAAIWKSYTQGGIRPKPILLTFSDGKQALLPLLAVTKFKGLLTLCHMASMDGGFGGWISTDSLSSAHAQLMIQFLTQELGTSLFWRLNPYDNLVLESEIPSHEYDETHVINLSKDFKTLYTNQSSPVRKARKAAKEGVWIKEASSLEDWQEYFQVYQSSLKRWGDRAITEYPWQLFQELYQQHSNQIKLWLAVYEDRIISGAVCFYAKKHVVYWQGATLEDYFHLRPVNLLLYSIMKDCYEQEYTWFDLFPSGGMEGVIAFKKSLGASPLPCPIVQIDQPVSPVKQFANHLKGKVTGGRSI